jgi:hypothetical protein
MQSCRGTDPVKVGAGDEMKLNQRQKLVCASAGVLALVVLLFPPYQATEMYGGTRTGFEFIFDPPDLFGARVLVNAIFLCLELLAVAVLTGIGLLITSDDLWPGIRNFFSPPADRA